MILRTERLLLRDFAEADWPAVLAYQNDARYLRFYEGDERTEADAREFVQRFLDQQREEPRIRFQLAITLDGEVIGSAAVVLPGDHNHVGTTRVSDRVRASAPATR